MGEGRCSRHSEEIHGAFDERISQFRPALIVAKPGAGPDRIPVLAKTGISRSKSAWRPAKIATPRESYPLFEVHRAEWLWQGSAAWRANFSPLPLSERETCQFLEKT
jgi:hypothetical protein